MRSSRGSPRRLRPSAWWKCDCAIRDAVIRARVLPRLALLAAFVTTGAIAAAQGIAPPPSSAGTYVREDWTVADGLPINTITAILQTRDGYLWLGINDGVVRFDGVRFTVYNAGNTPELPSNRIVSLFEDRAGPLWIVT